MVNSVNNDLVPFITFYNRFIAIITIMVIDATIIILMGLYFAVKYGAKGLFWIWDNVFTSNNKYLELTLLLTSLLSFVVTTTLLCEMIKSLEKDFPKKEKNE